jgi:ABC-type uncharacterized transport system permease subunit
MSGVQIICFASCYAIALALEISRLLFRSTLRGALLVVSAGAGLLAHSAFLYYRALRSRGAPLSSSQDWYLLAAWVLVVVYLYLLYFRPKTPFGLVLLPLVLALIGTAHWLADAQPFAREPASKVWGVIHGASILLATVAVLLGFAAGVGYLAQRWRLKGKRPPPGGLRLPSLEWLERANSHAILLAVGMLGIGIISGVILNAIRHAEPRDRLPWNDPVVVSTLAMFVWLLLAAVVGRVRRSAWQGRRVAWLTVASFVVLVIALAMMLRANTQHGGKKTAAKMYPAHSVCRCERHTECAGYIIPSPCRPGVSA